MSHRLDFITSFGAAKRGNVAMIFALSVIPFMVIAGLAIDIGRAILVRERLGHALDAAILAVGAAPHLTNEEAQQFGEQFFHANFDNGPEGVGYDINVTVLDDTVTMTARADVPTTLLALINKDTIGLYMDATAVRGGQNLELALVLDNSVSMTMEGRMSALKDASQDALEILFNGAGSDPDAVKVALVPFGNSVNVGSEFEGAWWLDPEGESSVHYDSLNFSEPVNRWDLFDELNEDWAGCVEARPEPFDIEDTPPSAGNPDTLFVPYFLADVPGRRNNAEWGYRRDHSWLDDGDWEEVYDDDGGACPGLGQGHGYGCGGHGEAIYDDEDEARHANVEKYYSGQNPYGDGPNTWCISQPILPLTTSQSLLEDRIDDMVGESFTNIAAGTAWGVRVLSPGMPFTEGSPFGEEELVKAMIVLTDGDNWTAGEGSHLMSAYSSFGYAAEGRLGAPTGNDNTLTDYMNGKTEDACDHAKELGIRVYTITFKVESDETQELMEGCASTDEDGDPLYWDSPNNAELQSTFAAIARDLISLRLSQ